jgi:hypothetical protein
MVTSSAQAELVLADDADVDRYAEPTRILLIESDPRRRVRDRPT